MRRGLPRRVCYLTHQPRRLISSRVKTPGIIQARLLWTSKLRVIAGILLASAASAQLLPFPLSANHRATVVTLEPPVAAAVAA